MDKRKEEGRILQPHHHTIVDPGSALQLSANFVQIVAVNVFQDACTIAIEAYFEFRGTLCLPELQISIVFLHNLGRPKVSLNGLLSY